MHHFVALEIPELSRAFLASFILVMDLLILMQDWDFPHFSNPLAVNLSGFRVASLNFRFLQIRITGSFKLISPFHERSRHAMSSFMPIHANAVLSHRKMVQLRCHSGCDDLGPEHVEESVLLSAGRLWTVYW